MNKIEQSNCSPVISLKDALKNLKTSFSSALGCTNYWAAIDYGANINTNIEDSKTQVFKTITHS